MSRALVTFAMGSEHQQMMAIALPTFREFAARHGYAEIRSGPPVEAFSDRPPSWGKIPALRAALAEHDEALWVDCDALIVDPSEDISAPAEAWHALVEHHTPDGHVPNLGVWLVRQPMQPVLEQAWRMTEYVQHGWWEQAALMDLMGYALHRPTRHLTPTGLFDRTYFLDPGWNVHKWDQGRSERDRILHATMYPDRVTTMRGWALQADALADTATVIL